MLAVQDLHAEATLWVAPLLEAEAKELAMKLLAAWGLLLAALLVACKAHSSHSFKRWLPATSFEGC